MAAPPKELYSAIIVLIAASSTEAKQLNEALLNPCKGVLSQEPPCGQLFNLGTQRGSQM